jgi:pimeloyl-ACP methyl ester carboxylesterase/DNA-binding CsgD family transcriptional regulator
VERAIRFCITDLGRIAFATVGTGPALVMPPAWIGHLEAAWEEERYRDFVTALAERHTVVSYDSLGTGLSERRRDERDFTLAADVRVLAAVVDAAGVERCMLFGFSLGGCAAAAYAAEHSRRVQRLVLYGSYADGSRVASAETRRELPDMFRKHRKLASRVLASVFWPDASPEELRRLDEFHRRAATPDTTARLLRHTYEVDVTEELKRVDAPTLVLHRRGDRTVPYELGLEVASLVPGARFEPLTGSDHLPWLGDAAALLRAIAEFVRLGPYALRSQPAVSAEGTKELTDRELEVLRLVADGLSDNEIAERLVLSPHTVHRHVANLRAKLGQPSRAAAAAAAARRGLI